MGKSKILNNKVLLGLILMVISLTSNAQETEGAAIYGSRGEGGVVVITLKR